MGAEWRRRAEGRSWVAGGGGRSGARGMAGGHGGVYRTRETTAVATYGWARRYGDPQGQPKGVSGGGVAHGQVTQGGGRRRLSRSAAPQSVKQGAHGAACRSSRAARHKLHGPPAQNDSWKKGWRSAACAVMRSPARYASIWRSRSAWEAGARVVGHGCGWPQLWSCVGQATGLLMPPCTIAQPSPAQPPRTCDAVDVQPHSVLTVRQDILFETLQPLHRAHALLALGAVGPVEAVVAAGEVGGVWGRGESTGCPGGAHVVHGSSMAAEAPHPASPAEQGAHVAGGGGGQVCGQWAQHRLHHRQVLHVFVCLEQRVAWRGGEGCGGRAVVCLE